jgi:hypothetical protein
MRDIKNFELKMKGPSGWVIKNYAEGDDRLMLRGIQNQKVEP